jgi:hypothetical protein
MSSSQSPGPEAPLEKSFPCPFPQCNVVFAKQTLLKNHLRDIRGCGFDTTHYEGHPEWRKLDAMHFLLKHTRPKGMPMTERVQRRAETNKRHYDAHREEIRVKSKARREKINDTLSVAKTLGTYTQKIQSTRTLSNRLARELYGSSAPYKIEKFVDIDGPVTFETFPRLVIFYLPQNLLPNIHAAVPGETRMFDAIPAATHFRKTSSLIHPDKNNSGKIQSLLNAAYDLWRPVIDDLELAEVKVHPNDDATVKAFVLKGVKYQNLSAMYFCTYVAMSQGIQLLLPSTLSIDALGRLLETEEEEEWLTAEEDIKHLIIKALEAPAVEKVSKNGVVGTKRRRTEVEDVALEASNNTKNPNAGRNSSAGSARSCDSSASTSPLNSISPPAESTIDPQLLRHSSRLRSRV